MDPRTPDTPDTPDTRGPSGPTDTAGPAPLPKDCFAPGLSVGIMCKDGARTLGATLDAVGPIADEIVALDSGSTDATLDLLANAGAVVHPVQWEGFVRTRQRVMDACSREWVLCLDTDEAPDEILCKAIRDLVDREPQTMTPGGIAGARLNRKLLYRGRLLHHAWQPEPRLRLVRRSLVASGVIVAGGVEPHDGIEFREDQGVSGRVVDLDGTLIHDSFETFAEHLETQARYGRRMAQSLADRGKRGSLVRVLTSPAGAFLKQMIMKSAWRDGWPGVLAGLSAASGALAKHTALLELTRVERGARSAVGNRVRIETAAQPGGISPKIRPDQGISRDRSTLGPAEEPGPP